MQAHVVLGQQAQADFFIQFGFVVFHPKDFRERESGKRRVASDVEQGGTEARGQVGAFRGRALVAPEDGGPQGPVRRVKGGEPVHLAGEPHGGNVSGSGRARVPQRTQGAGGGMPPGIGVLLGPTRMRYDQGVLLRGRSHHAALRVNGKYFHPGRTDVDAHYEVHVCTPFVRGSWFVARG